MNRSQSDSAPSSAQPPTPSPSQQAPKRHETEAGLPPRESPPKKQQIEPPTDDSFLNLSTILLVGKTRDGKVVHGPIDEFSDASVHGTGTSLRPVHISYEKFRTWAEETLQLPQNTGVRFVFIGASGSSEQMIVSTKWDFKTVLHKLWTRAFRLFPQNGHGGILRVVEAQAKAPPIIQPAAQVQQATEPEPKTPPKPETLIAIDDDDKSPEQDSPATDDEIAELDNQQPLLAKEFLKLVREAETANDVSLNPAEKDEPGADSRLYKIDARILKRALIFFNTNLDDEGKCRVLCMHGSLHIWQIYTAFEALINPTITGVNGLCIGLDVGYGKTRLVVLILLARAVMWRLEKEVVAEWEAEDPNLHLPRHENGRCPSQDNYMIQCPCSWDEDTRNILDYMVDLPAVIIGPPNLRDTWMSELEKALVDFGKDDQFLNFYYLYGSATPGKDLRDNTTATQVVKATKGIINKMNSVDVGNGTARDIFLVSSRMSSTLLEKFPMERKKSVAAFGLFVMDEMQNYQGTEKYDTIPQQTLDTIQHYSYNPVTLITLCGTIVEQGPIFWRAPRNHFMKQWKAFGDNLLTVKSGNPPAVLTSPGYFAKEHKQLVYEYADESVISDETKKKTDAIRAYLSPFVRSLRQNQMWRGEVLNKLPEVHDCSKGISPLDDPETKKARHDLISSVETLISEELSRKKKDWTRRKKLAFNSGGTFDEEEPTRQDVIEGQVSNDTQEGAWLKLSRLASYPHLAVLQDKKLVLDKLFGSSECQAVPVALQAELERDPNRYYIRADKFREWEFTKHAEKLEENSPKLREFRGLINRVVNDNDPKTEPQDDPCKARHIIAFFSHTISAVVTYQRLITDKTLCKKIQPILFTSGVKIERRQQIMKEMVQPGVEGGRTKVLIAVTDIAAEGFNLQRVNNIIFMELPPTLTKYQQAVGRACRTGQKMKVNIVRLYDEENLLETTNMKALEGKKLASERIYNVKRP